MDIAKNNGGYCEK